MLSVENNHKIAFIDREGNTFTYNRLVEDIEYVKGVLATTRVTSVAIIANNIYFGTVAYIACINTGMNVTVINEDSSAINITKISEFNPEIILTDFKTGKLYERFTYNIKTGELDGEKVAFALNALHPINYRANEEPIITEFHKEFLGYSGYNVSKFKTDSVLDGINQNRLGYDNNSILYLEDFSIIYHINNGIITPLLNGCTINCGLNCTKESIVYSSVNRLIELMDITYIKGRRYLKFYPKWILNKVMARKTLFNTKPMALILAGKPVNDARIQKSNISITSLYVNKKVATYISSKKLYKSQFFNSKQSVGNIKHTGDLLIVNKDSLYGDILYRSNDSAFYNKLSSKDKIFTEFKDFISLEDVGYSNEYGTHVISNADKVFSELYGKPNSVEHILEYSLKQPIVNKIQFTVNTNGVFIMVVQPDEKYLRDKGINIYVLKEMLDELRDSIIKKFRIQFRFDVFLYTGDPDMFEQFPRLVDRKDKLNSVNQ